MLSRQALPDNRSDYFETHLDSARRRWRDSARPYRTMLRYFAPYGRLYAYRFDLPEGLALHSPEAARCARETVARLFVSAPARWKLEAGSAGRLHVHVTSPLPPVAVPEAEHAALIYDLRGWAGYLSKPADPRLCRSRLTPYSPDRHTRLRRADAACFEYGEARREALSGGRRRLSPKSGWVGARPARPALPVALTLSLIALSLRWAAALSRLPVPRQRATRYLCPVRPCAPVPGLTARTGPQPPRIA